MPKAHPDWKLKDLLEFPCPFTYKVIGHANPELHDRVAEVFHCYVSGKWTPIIRPSAKGNYYSISISTVVVSIEQVENLYRELGAIDAVLMVL